MHDQGTGSMGTLRTRCSQRASLTCLAVTAGDKSGVGDRGPGSRWCHSTVLKEANIYCGCLTLTDIGRQRWKGLLDDCIESPAVADNSVVIFLHRIKMIKILMALCAFRSFVKAGMLDFTNYCLQKPNKLEKQMNERSALCLIAIK